jgi:capsular polysaccharide biosynthesis protein
MKMRLLLGAVVLGAVVVTVASLSQTPTYEASALLLVGESSPAQETGNGKIQLIPNAPAPGGLQDLTHKMTMAIDTSPVAEGAIRRLGLRMKPAELLDRLSVEQDTGTSFIRLTYQDTDPQRARLIVNTVGEVSSGRIPLISAAGSNFTATVWEKATVPESPVSPHPWRNGVFTLVVGLMLCTGLTLALPGAGTRIAGALGERPSRQGVGQAGMHLRRHSTPSIVERVREKKLLLALGRRGKLTAVEAALETSLSVEEANRILFDLAAGGHLEVTVDDGKLLYSFWEHGAP